MTETPADLPPRPGPAMLTPVGETAAMIRFYSRLPLPALGRFDDPAAPPPFAIACRMLPVASLFVGLPAALAGALLALTHLPGFVSAALIVAVAILTTGALHEDGLADVADGFGGGSTVARKLEIMKDSRVGSYGVVALVVALAARIGLVAALVPMGSLRMALALCAGAVVSRVASLTLFAALPAARPGGVATAVGRPAIGPVVTAIALGLAMTAALALPVFGAATCLGVLGATLVTIAIARLASAQIGGQTGDVIGAAQVLAEIGFFAGLLVL